jgi:CBS domain containing-hemolysin-like protein
MIGLLLLTVLLLLANGFFVAAEFALVKVRSTQLEVRAAEGQRTAALARSLVDHLDAYLSATQLGITLTSLGLGWIGEPAFAALLEPLLHWLQVPEEYEHKIAVAVGFVVISFAHIVIGEIAPKSLAIARPVGVSMAVSVPMRAFYLVFYPALIVLNASANLLLRLAGIEPANSHSLAVAQEELVRIAADSAAEGQISERQGQMLSKVFRFTNRQAHEIMVPRNRVHYIDLSDDIDEQLAEALELGHSRYPVSDGDLDDVKGLLHLKDLLRLESNQRTAEMLRAIARDALFVPDSLPAEKVMRRMQVQRTHLAMVVDEHGVVAGVVSLEDALEELVGEIQDEHDHETDEVRVTDAGFEFSGVLNVDELCAALEVPEPETEASTLQGYLMEKLERVPREGDKLELDGWLLVVREMNSRTVTQVDATRVEQPAPEAGTGRKK